MNNFTYYNPTRIVFGKDSIAQLPKYLPEGKKILMTYGGGSIQKNGVYDQVKAALAGFDVTEFGGIQPNPLYETLMEALQIVREKKIEFLLSVGGGSVLDGTKFVAAAACYTGVDPWDIPAKKIAITAALPVGSVLTLPATGSEMNGNAVISRKSTQEKFALYSEHVIPRFSILDPVTTMTLPSKQTRNGIIDAWVHVVEQYVTYPVRAPLQDRQAEGILMTLSEEGPKVMSNPNDYDARANVMWSATQALNGLIVCGVPSDFATHMIGHELTAIYGLDHAETLSIVLPSLWRHQKATKGEKLEQYARRVWKVKAADSDAAIEEGIRDTVSFFESLGMKTHFADYGISAAEASQKVSERFKQRGTTLGEQKDITPDRVAAILKDC